MNKPMFKSIEFRSDDVILRGRLYTPGISSKKLPVIIMAHGYSATINGMVADRYAEVFSKAGFAVLLYDHRNLGISDGEPRQQLNRWTQARGYRDAIDFVITLPEIDSTKIGLWGDSMSGDEVIVVAAMDHRVKTVVVQVPACGRELPQPDPDGKLFQSIKETFLHGNVEGTPETTLGPMPIVSFDQQSIPSLLKPLTAYRWFIEYGTRYNTGWINNATYVTPNVPTKFNSVLCIPYIKAALLMMVAHDDEIKGANSNVARHAFEIAPQPKKMIEIDGGHFGLLYYPSPLFDQTSKAQVDFFKEYLQ
ncbi:alpha/beta hydrolase [Gaetbulibacter saemankumensis]|uniref:alpha/beta hydrolase n=1 Tax=Gaetbulibacter saemankumensis TaxID=311208 RepID=UPI00041F9D4C|nr:alpha/beta fold hydrolase [Gaetbulibacter saemankumensis]